MKKIVFSFFGFWMFAIIKPPTIHAQSCLAHDSLELVKLYKATNGAQWYESWDLTKPVKTWEGMYFTKDGCSVRILYLSYNNLSGSLPNLSLPKLEILHLHKNYLSGPLPNFDFPKLYHLLLDNNQLSGPIPNFNLPSLITLWLQNNQLSGSIPDFDLPNLKYLKLSDNQLSGPLPNFDLPDLKDLWLNNTQLTGPIPNFDLPNLEKLHLENNQLTGPLPNFDHSRFLDEVDLENNQLSGSIPDFSYSNGIPMADVRRNHFTFQSLPPRKNIQVFFFDPQKPILIHKGKGNTIYVQAGGDLKKNTYTWYKDSAVYKTVVEDSALVVTEPGSYYCRITRQFGDFYHSNYPNYRPFFVNLQSHSISIGLIPTIELLQEPLFTQRIESKEEESGAILFPNPAKGRVSINIQGAEEKPVTIQVFDPLGRLRLSRSINQLTNTTAFLNVGSLSAGHYYVRIQVEGKPLATKPLIVSD